MKILRSLSVTQWLMLALAVFLLALSAVLPVGANLTPSNIAAHNHSSPQQGGSAITGATISSLAADIAVADGGTGAGTAAGARANLGAAASGANSDITSLTGLTTDIAVADGGTGASTAAAARANLAAAVSGANSDITSLTGLTGSVTSTKACASGFTRIAPNYCLASSNMLNVYMFGTVCSTISLNAQWGIPSSASAVDLEIRMKAVALNALGVRSVSVTAYVSDACGAGEAFGSGGGNKTAGTYEEVAKASAPTLLEYEVPMRVASSGGNVYIKRTGSAEWNGDTQVQVVGYWEN